MQPDRALRAAGAEILARHANASPPTQAQLEFLEKLLRSHVFTDDERERITRKASKDRATMTRALEWVRGVIKDRKAEEANQPPNTEAA